MCVPHHVYGFHQVNFDYLAFKVVDRKDVVGRFKEINY